MKEISLFDEDGTLLQDAKLFLHIYQVFPNDHASREQAFLVMEHEKRRWGSSKPGEYIPSDIVHSVVKDIDKKSAQRATCGLVALSLFALRYLDFEPTLGRASQIVSAFASDSDKLEFTSWFKGEERISVRPLPTDIATIKRYFRKYRAVAHLLAAEISCSLKHEPRQWFDWTDEENEEFVATALYYQAIFEEFPNFKDWDAWLLAWPPEPDELIPKEVIINAEAFANLVGQWLADKRIYPE